MALGIVLTAPGSHAIANVPTPAPANSQPPAELVSKFWGQTGLEISYVKLQEDGKGVFYLSLLFFKPNLFVITYVRWRGWKWEFKDEDILEILRLTDGKIETLWKAPPAAED